ncbi:hypothetical protein [Serratia sp. 22264]|uniref:hypothetical protein n=1 Tax=Serratia sp. 22264 TaxID=3453897 RepID=UPI003F82D7C7
MQTLINWTKSPIVVVDENGDRITIPAGQERSVNGNFNRYAFGDPLVFSAWKAY